MATRFIAEDANGSYGCGCAGVADVRSPDGAVVTDWDKLASIRRVADCPPNPNGFVLDASNVAPLASVRAYAESRKPFALLLNPRR